jgi:hypothetical protein
MLISSMVIDDFFADPMDVRNTLLKMDYPKPEGTVYYPGRDSLQQLKLPGIDELISDMTGEKVVSTTLQSHAHARISMAADDIDRKLTVHIDPGAVWSAIIYMNTPDQCQGGTEFFRHKETGMERAPVYPHELEEMGVENYVQGAQKILQKDNNDLSKWEKTSTVPMRFNRLVLLRPWHFHTSGLSFGDTNETGRLIYLMFFESAQHMAKG